MKSKAEDFIPTIADVQTAVADEPPFSEYNANANAPARFADERARGAFAALDQAIDQHNAEKQASEQTGDQKPPPPLDDDDDDCVCYCDDCKAANDAAMTMQVSLMVRALVETAAPYLGVVKRLESISFSSYPKYVSDDEPLSRAFELNFTLKGENPTTPDDEETNEVILPTGSGLYRFIRVGGDLA